MILQTYNFDELTDFLLSNVETHSFNLSDLPSYDSPEKIRTHVKFEKMFTSLDSKRTSCLYWFELSDNESCNKLIEVLNANRQTLMERNRTVPVRNYNCDSNVLYVGIRRGGYTKKWQLSNISGRMIQHFGYYEKGRTQGLQLAHWAIDAGLDIKLNIIQFEDDFPNAYLEAFEKIVAYKLRPLCGKH